MFFNPTILEIIPYFCTYQRVFMGNNSFFQFKQFTINQSDCAMKVGTDGVLLGSWTEIKSANYILDIGTGTGLTALS